MTRKKTTTGTMGSKRKTETKAKEKSAADKDTVPKGAEHKASEVIPEVAVALLEAHPKLPDRALILEAFANDFRGAKERAAEAAAHAHEEAERRVAEAASERDRSAQRKHRPTTDQPSGLKPRTATPPPAATAAAVVEVAARSAPTVVAPPVQAAAPEPVHEPEPVAVHAPESEPEPEPAFALNEAEAPTPAEPEPARASDDLFAMLHDEAPARSSDAEFDFAFGGGASQEKSSPFLASTLPAEGAGDDGATQMLKALLDDDVLGTPVSQEALEADAMPSAKLIAATDSTTMIQAMPDDEPAEDSGGSGRKSRKSSKKRRG